MRTPRTWTGSVATVVGVFVVGQVIGAGLFDLSDSHVVVSMFWVVVAAILSALWGRRVAVLFILPSAAAFVTNELISTSPVSPGFYSAASQIAPVILLALGLEEFSLRRQARTRFELVLFAVLLFYVVVAVGASLYGSAVCTGDLCQDFVIDWRVIGETYVILTAANLTAAGIVGGLVAIAGLAVVAGAEVGPRRAVADSESHSVQSPRSPSLVEAVLLWYALRRRSVR